ncbi:hypothetical protein QEN58_05900 [Halomonas alkaliantarctica]|uniref:Uncharacterized protein n=1 Tax=Halomonas alkaliantarctica TaxID=232346 RepID=A0ABY8LQ94_9GAMM|nr:hypothetical protein [Halomonas alkaliantarctica]WGI26590.1 hypothetical protein QEN58_05900 [Halomonas alkaliantarctica]
MKQLIRIPYVKIPEIYPTDEAMRSFKHDKSIYKPEVWEIEYLFNSYLKHLSDSELNDRYKKLKRNLITFYTDERCVIPIGIFHSTWYWLRKEHQARFEIYLRNNNNVLPPPDLKNTSSREKLYSKLKVGQTEKLFRYTKKSFAEDIHNGIIRFASAQTYLEMENDVARADDEKYKRAVFLGDNINITTLLGEEIKTKGNLIRTTGGIDYHMLCFSLAWDESLFSDFNGSTHCAVVNDITELCNRIERAGSQTYNNWYFHHGPINYYDPYETTLNTKIDSAMFKDCTFAYQQEYRIIWARLQGSQVEGPQFIKTGDLSDIIDLIAKPNSNN